MCAVEVSTHCYLAIVRMPGLGRHLINIFSVDPRVCGVCVHALLMLAGRTSMRCASEVVFLDEIAQWFDAAIGKGLPPRPLSAAAIEKAPPSYLQLPHLEPPYLYRVCACEAKLHSEIERIVITFYFTIARLSSPVSEVCQQPGKCVLYAGSKNSAAKATAGE